MTDKEHDNANSLIEEQLDRHLESIAAEMSADVLVFKGAISYGSDDLIRDALEAIDNKKEKLAFILETGGGYIEVAQRIVDTTRRYYSHVEFVVPNHAMSAGTVLVMSGDSIHMDYYAVLGPIDPQVQRPGGSELIPALGYLAKYNELVEKSASGDLTTAEAAYFVERFDPAELYLYEQSRELSIELLKEWLVKYKFKDWHQTESQGLEVTHEMRVQRAVEIAEKLNDTESWHSHARGISMQVLRRVMNLKIDDFGEKPELNRCIRTYYKLGSDYLMRRGHSGLVHTLGRYVPLV